MNIDNPSSTHLQGLKSLLQEAFNDSDDFINSFFNTAFDKDRCLISAENGRVVAALYWFDCYVSDRKIAYIYAVAVSKLYRGCGIGKMLMQSAHTRLLLLGYEGVVLVPASKELITFYSKLGYIKSGYKSRICCSASSNKTNISRIGKEEFAILRRKYLPEGGVLQENENLSFLEEQAEMYEGCDFTLVARREGDLLLGIELLGNTDKAPDILNTLGYKEGIFYIMGEDISFSMYYPLRDKNFSPTYFGIAFD